MTLTNDERCLIDLWWSGVQAVTGEKVVAEALASDNPYQPDLIIAIGKAASSMCLGAVRSTSNYGRAVVVTKYGHADNALNSLPRIDVLEAGHPIPDENSLAAGAIVLDAVRTQPPTSKLLILVSGGASALVESLRHDLKLDDWQAQNARLIASGLSIDSINRERSKVSAMKDGRLLADFRGREIRAYALSDVRNNDIAVIGSGVASTSKATCTSTTCIVGTNQKARDQVVKSARRLGFEVRCNEESMYGDVYDVARRIGDALVSGSPGVYVWGGEPTIELPNNPGEGGRNQSLALALAKEVSGKSNIIAVVAGTDGTDGPTDAAGAIVNGETFDDPSVGGEALLAANAGHYLRSRGRLFLTGPTNTNVMDLVVALVGQTTGEA